MTENPKGQRVFTVAEYLATRVVRSERTPNRLVFRAAPYQLLNDRNRGAREPVHQTQSSRSYVKRTAEASLSQFEFIRRHAPKPENWLMRVWIWLEDIAWSDEEDADNPSHEHLAMTTT